MSDETQPDLPEHTDVSLWGDHSGDYVLKGLTDLTQKVGMEIASLSSPPAWSSPACSSAATSNSRTSATRAGRSAGRPK